MKDYMTAKMRLEAIQPPLFKRYKDYLFNPPQEYFQELKRERLQQLTRINNLGLRKDYGTYTIEK